MTNLAQAHCRNNFYREFAWKTSQGLDTPNKKGILLDLRRDRIDPIRNKSHLIAKIIRYKNRPGEYVSVFSFEKLHQVNILDEQNIIKSYKGSIVYESAKINRIYLDFDNESNPEMAVKEALLVIKSLAKHKIYSHCYFSGGKGIALYIEFKTTNIKPENKKDVLKLFVDSVIETIKTEQNYDLQYLDYKVSFDLARVSRIPNTLHKSGLYCIPLSYGDMRRGIEFIKHLASKPSSKDLDDIITSCICRNEKIPTIIKNLENQVIINKETKSTELYLKHKHSEIIKKFYINTPKSISDDMIKQARRVSLSSIISSNNRIRCPIHKGTNPTSFYINHDKNIWYCHSCGKGGDVIKYIQEKEHLSFKEAILFLLK